MNPCDCRRKRHTLLPQAGDDPVRWARCGEPDGRGGWAGGCGALSRWSSAPVPSWLQRHAADIAVTALPLAVILGWMLAHWMEALP
jgi:hypothetical protein